MEEYESNLIETVETYPLLWNPTHRDYKDKDQRNQVWEAIDRTIKHPKGISGRATWTELCRRYSNYIVRIKKKRSGSGASSIKPWKHAEKMGFLDKAKDERTTSGNLPDSYVLDEDDDSISGDIVQCAIDQSDISLDCDDPKEDESVTQIEPPRRSGPVPKKKKANVDDPLNQAALAITKRFATDERRESARMGFFRSILPQVEKLSDDGFLDFQQGVITALRQCRTPPAPPPVIYQPPYHVAPTTHTYFPPSTPSPTGSEYSSGYNNYTNNNLSF